MSSLLDLFVATAHAQDGAAAPRGGGGFEMIIMFGTIIAIWYFLVIRPQAKQQKAHGEMVAALKKGDSVVLASGIHGKVHAVEDAVLHVEVAKGVRLRVDKNKVARATDGAAAIDEK